MGSARRCWFAGVEGAGPCSGRLVRAHLIKQQAIRREMRPRIAALHLSGTASVHALAEVAWDPRCWTWMCGGPMGNAGHHGAFDSRSGHGAALVIARADLPPGLEEFAEQYGLEHRLEAQYGRREVA